MAGNKADRRLKGDWPINASHRTASTLSFYSCNHSHSTEHGYPYPQYTSTTSAPAAYRVAKSSTYQYNIRVIVSCLSVYKYDLNPLLPVGPTRLYFHAVLNTLPNLPTTKGQVLTANKVVDARNSKPDHVYHYRHRSNFPYPCLKRYDSITALLFHQVCHRYPHQCNFDNGPDLDL